MNCVVSHKIVNSEEKIIKNNISATYEKNILKYKSDEDHIKLTISRDNIIMTKDNLSSETILNFIEGKKTTSQYKIKLLNSIIDISVLTNKLQISSDRIYIEYEIWFDLEYSGKFIYELNIREMK